MNNIDILEELKNKQYTNKDILGNLVLSEEEYTAISNLISENKELKENSIPKLKVEELIKKYEWSIEHYDSDEADYRQSQDVGSWHALQSLLGKE